MLHRDNWILGVVIGLILPLLVYGLAISVLSRYGHVDGLIYLPRPRVPGLLAVFSNLIPFRYYMVNKKYDRTGRGILLITFAYALLFFYFFL